MQVIEEFLCRFHCTRAGNQQRIRGSYINTAGAHGVEFAILCPQSEGRGLRCLALGL